MPISNGEVKPLKNYLKWKTKWPMRHGVLTILFIDGIKHVASLLHSAISNSACGPATRPGPVHIGLDHEQDDLGHEQLDKAEQ